MCLCFCFNILPKPFACFLVEYNDEHGNPIWKNRVESWKDKKNKKKKAPSKAKADMQIPSEQQIEEKQ